MRDKIKNSQYFESFIDKKISFLHRYIEAYSDESLEFKKRLGFAYDFFRNRCHIAVASYSAGASVSDVREQSIAAIDALQVFVELGQQDREYFLYGDGGGYSGGFDMWYRLLAWCILFDLPREKTDIVLDYLVLQMSNPEHATDALANKLIKALGYPGQDETDHLLWPEAYAPLYECFKQADVYPERQLQAFMKDWYHNMSDTYWYENHKGRHDTYFGYWCFEAAAVAKILNIDDAALKDHPNYPYDARHGMKS
ncbi:PoNe immunity protein domain-containing protein [Fulvimarina sp. MAC8]|uniref:PoNe immunity protein domain-containing protein n=1 Tax=Fulvimarina sp. MAC8 TaxID=3162874 RepID=UPI0032EFAD8B